MGDNLFQKICGLLTKHRWRRGRYWSVDITPTEYHYKCKICRKSFWCFKPFDGAPPQRDPRDPAELDRLMKENPSAIWPDETSIW